MKTNTYSASPRPRIAVIGARGIGKHHAKWWALEGADVRAFLGTSDASVAQAREGLASLFGFQGNGYTDFATMVETEKPDIIDVCSPPALHYEHVKMALESGCHVLCEKPFVYDPKLDTTTTITRAQELVALAKARGLRLGVCTQYSAGARLLDRIWNEKHPGEIVMEYHGHLESPAKGREPDPCRVWMDLAPHPISVLLKLASQSEIMWDSVWTRFEGYEAMAEFSVRRVGLPPLHAFIVTRNSVEPPRNVRHFRYNNETFEVEGENDADGVYQARIDTANGAYRDLDMMRALIRDFAQGTPAADADESVRNLSWVLQLRDAAMASRT